MEPLLKGRNGTSDEELEALVRRFRRRRHRQATELARLLVALDTLAGDRGRPPLRRIRRASLGAARG